ncbi:hypothetical protein, partial [Crocosphaera sp.]|uniref:hypothetical protein n=1 Tax=Crocosphaera sp. TaxID=2729996 RepID=UPI00257E4CB7
ISISPKNYHFSSLDWAFKLICEKSGMSAFCAIASERSEELTRSGTRHGWTTLLYFDYNGSYCHFLISNEST